MFYLVTNISGSQITARRITNRRSITMDGSKFKLGNSIMMGEDHPVVANAEDDIQENGETYRRRCSLFIPVIAMIKKIIDLTRSEVGSSH